jgi:hypothetical protein
MNGAEKDSERKSTVALAAVVSREFAFSLFPLFAPAQSLSKPSIEFILDDFEETGGVGFEPLL